MKKHHTSAKKKQMLYCLAENGRAFRIPAEVLERYNVKSKSSIEKAHESVRIAQGVPAREALQSVGIDPDDPAIKLKGLRLREGLNQTEFAKMIDITQGDLSKMERGLRPIGKTMAKRIAKVFKISYQHFL